MGPARRTSWSWERWGPIALTLAAACTFQPVDPPEVGALVPDGGTPPSLDAAERPPAADASHGSDASLPEASVEAPPASVDGPHDLGRADAVPDTAPAAPDTAAPVPDGPPARPPDTGSPVCAPKPPAMIFNATPPMTCGVACNPGNALAMDGRMAGLDCNGGGTALIDGKPVTGCVGADFGTVMNLDPVVVWAASVRSACGTACTTQCGTGDTALVFHGRVLGQYQFAAEIRVLDEATDYRIRTGATARYVLVCRGGSGSGRDDVAVDAIASRAGCPDTSPEP